MHYIQVNVGRNYTDKQGKLSELSDKQWERMESLISSALMRFTTAPGLIERHEGRGCWDGISEDSKHISVVAEGVDEAELRAFMAKVASLYQQEAIAVVISSAPLVRQDGFTYSFEQLAEMVK